MQQPLLAAERAFLADRLEAYLRVWFWSISVRLGKPDEFPRARNLAYCTVALPPVIYVAPKFLDRPITTILGVLAHEYGHAYLIDQKAPDHSEHQCDLCAEALFGYPIGYDTKDVQVFGLPDRPRPKHLGA